MLPLSLTVDLSVVYAGQSLRLRWFANIARLAGMNKFADETFRACAVASRTKLYREIGVADIVAGTIQPDWMQIIGKISRYFR